MSTRGARVAALVVVVIQAMVGAAQEVVFVRITGERPSVFSRPVIDDRFLIGQARSDDEFPVLIELALDLPQPFFQSTLR